MKYKFEDSGRKHLHTFAKDDVNYKPLMGTTTVINEIYPPPLAWWGSAMCLGYFGWVKPNDKVDGKYVAFPKEQRLAGAKKVAEVLLPIINDDEKLLEELDNAYKAHDTYKKSKGKEGTDKHALIEGYIKNCLLKGGKPLQEANETVKGESNEIKSFIEWANRDVEQFLWSEAHVYSEDLWVGGITDFGFIHKNGKKVIGDAKPSIYPKHFIQTGGYNLQIKENGLFDSEGKQILEPIKDIAGYCIFDYNKGVAQYLSGNFIDRLEKDFIHTVEMYNRRDLTGSETLE